MADEPDTETVRDQLEELRESLDDLQDALGPLNLKDQTSTFASYAEQEKLDPIGKAKILVTLGYAIDSLLFSYLKATGVSTESHTIMNELERIKQYIGKIKSATVQQRRVASSLDKPAANRLIGHDLAGNAALDRERATRTADSNRRIQAKLADLSHGMPDIGKHTRFSNSAIMQDPQESLTPANTTSHDPSILSIIDDEDSPGLSDLPPEPSTTNKEGDSARHSNRLAKPGKPAASTTTTMFEESKPEKKNRERRERKAAKKERQKATKAKQAAKMIG